MSFKFKPEDFEYYTLNPDDSKVCADKANRILQAHLATLPRVYSNHSSSKYAEWYGVQDDNNTHTALLWGITEIEKKEECNHWAQSPDGSYRIVCGACGIRLRATGWEPA